MNPRSPRGERLALARHLRARNAELRQTRNELGSLMRGLREGVLLLDRDERILRVNPAAARMLRSPGSRLEGVDLEAALERCGLRRTQGTRTGECTLEGSAGQLLLARRSRVEPGGGGGARRLLLLRDQSRERELERLRTDLVATVSHELRTPLTAVIGFASLLLDQEGLPESTRRESLESIRGRASDLNRLLGSWLQLARADTGERHHDLQRVRWQTVLELALGQAEELRESTDARLEIRTEVPALEVEVDARYLACAVSNLLSNARKYSEGQARIELSSRIEGDELWVEVIDEGVGIPVEEQARVFQRFHRIPQPGREIPGTGFGLAIVESVVRAHGGRCELESEPGVGSCFRLCLPLARLQPWKRS